MRNINIKMMRMCWCFFIFSFLITFINQSVTAQSVDDLKQQANELHSKMLTIDSHADTPMQFFTKSSIDLGKRNTNTKVDFIKMHEGGLNAVFFAVYLEQGIRDAAGFIIAEKKAVTIFKSIIERVEKYPDMAVLVTTPADVYKAKQQGKLAILIGIENGYCIGTDLSNIAKFKQLGANYITLSHTKNNDICDSSTDKPEHNGLSDFGVKVVREMNRLGIMIDVSHTANSTVRDVARYSKAPVIASHSCALALTINRRNLSDDMIRLIAKTGGVVQVCLVSHFLKPSAQGRATVTDVVNHIDHIVKVAGIDYVGIGSDFDGGGGVIGCKDASEFKNITVELLRRDYTPKEIEKIWGANLLRVMTNVQLLAE